MAPPIRTRAPMPGSSPAPIRIGPSRAASATTFPRKPPKPSPTPSSRSPPPSKELSCQRQPPTMPAHRRARPRRLRRRLQLERRHPAPPGGRDPGDGTPESAARHLHRLGLHRQLPQPDPWARPAVGHSYGGAVISNAATDAANVVGLVFVAAFAPDEGERLGEVEGGSK